MKNKEWWKIGHELHGRKKILIPKPDSLTDENIKKCIEKALYMHKKNAIECLYLWNYYKGKQPIIDKEKIVRPDINHVVLVNRAKEFTSFKMNYGYSDPIQFTQRCLHNAVDKSLEAGVKSGVHAFNDLMSKECKATKDHKLQKYRHVCGTAYRMVLPKKGAVFKMGSLKPWEAFVVYDTDLEETPWLCGKIFTTEIDGNECDVLTCYTLNQKIDYRRFGKQDDYFKIVSTTFDYLPIIEYPLNEELMGCFEPVLWAMDAINSLQSNAVDSVEQNVQYFIMYKNCDITLEDHDKFIAKGVIKVKSNNSNSDSDVKIVTVELDLTNIQATCNSLYQAMLQILSIPDRNSSSGGNTGTSIKMSSGYEDAEKDAKSSMLLYEEPERYFIDAVLRIAKNSEMADPILKTMTSDEFEIKSPRNRTDNYLVKGQGMMMELQAGINPRTALQNSGLYSDPEQVFADSPALAKWLDYNQGTNNVSQQEVIKKEEDTLEKPPITV